MLIHFEDYLKAITIKVPIAKNGIQARFIQKITLVSLKKYCIFLIDEGLNNADDQTFRLFFNVAKEDNLKLGIQKFDNDKLRPIKSFLDGKTEAPSHPILEMIAILIDFNPRPFNKYLKSDCLDNNISTIENFAAEGKLIDESKEGIRLSMHTNIPKNEKIIINETNTNNKRRIKQIGIAAIVILCLFGVGYSTKDILYPKKQCMQWEYDHFEMVYCDTKINSFGKITTLVPYNDIEFNLKRIFPNKETSFFLKGKPLVWYSKINNDSILYYNNHGFDPNTGKPLKPITLYIIEKYINK